MKRLLLYFAAIFNSITAALSVRAATQTHSGRVVHGRSLSVTSAPVAVPPRRKNQIVSRRGGVLSDDVPHFGEIRGRLVATRF